MKHIFHIDRSERVVVAIALAVLLPLHWLMVAKFAPLLMHYDVDTWRTFMRNYHMSGFDPIVYHAVADGSMAFDLLRHPLLAAVLYPLYLLNMALTAATGVNCVQFVVAALLMAVRGCRTAHGVWPGLGADGLPHVPHNRHTARCCAAAVGTVP